MKKLILLLIVIFVVGCSGSINKLTAIDWWNNNEIVALEILKLLELAPLVERVEIDTRKELIKNYYKFDAQAWKIYRKVEKIMKVKNIEVVTFHQLEDVTILDLIVDRYGISIAGCSLSILYYSDDAIYHQNSIKHAIYSEQLKPNWYLEINGDKECIK